MKNLAPILLLLAACETETPTKAVVENGFAPEEELTVRHVWWETTYFADATQASEERTVPATDYAYAVVARSDGSLLVMKSKEPLSVARGDTLRIVVSDATFAGNCAAGAPLSQGDADFLVERIFPADFEGKTYDAATCTTK